MSKYIDTRHAALPEKILARVQVTEAGCWEWTHTKNQKGYGRFKHEGRVIGAHRLSYTAFVGPIPDGLDIDHLCRNRGCVNPEHLEAVTHVVNCHRGDVGAHFGTKTHCPSGHPYSGENLRLGPQGQRMCKTCMAVGSRRRKAAAVGVVALDASRGGWFYPECGHCVGYGCVMCSGTGKSTKAQRVPKNG